MLTAIRAAVEAEVRSDGDRDDRTPAQRRADALTEICRQWLDRADRPLVAGERPHITATVQAEALSSEAAAVTFDQVGATPGAARRLSCDASVMRVVMSGRLERRSTSGAERR